MAKKAVFTKTEVDREGNISTFTSEINIKRQHEVNFGLLINEHLFLLNQLSCNLDFKVFIFLATMSEYAKGYVKLTSADRKELTDSIGTNRTNFGNSLTRLKRAKLIAGERDRFYINPLVFWRGSIQERDKMLKNDGRNILSKFGYSLNELKDINKQFGFLKSEDFLESLTSNIQESEPEYNPPAAPLLPGKEENYTKNDFDLF